MRLPVGAIKNFDEDQVVNIISNTIHNHDNATGNSLFNYYPTFNPIDKLIEAMEENKKLYERLLEEGGDFEKGVGEVRRSKNLYKDVVATYI